MGVNNLATAAVIRPWQVAPNSLQGGAALGGVLQAPNSSALTLQPQAPIATLQNGSIAKPGGSVQGAAIAPPAARVATPEEIAAATKAANDARTAQAVNAGYGQIIGTYDRQLGELPGQIDAAGQLVTSAADSQAKSIQSGYDRGNANLAYARNDLNTKTGRSIQDLAKSIRQSFDSYSTLIGSKGAGDSSAGEFLSYALQKAQAENRTSIYRNEGDQLGQIGLKQGDLDAQHSDQMQKLDAWKQQSIIQIGQQFQAERANIEAQKAGANKEKLMALASLNSNLVNQAIAALSGVEAQHNNAVKTIQDSVAKLQAPGSGSTLAATNFTPVAAAAATAPGINLGDGSATPADSFSALPYYKKLTAAGA